ncbi:uncharacterized protein KD926_006532 [Aspergillus affinis]|uniref:uncharacterized protein n=1 Tax=Aspergillus affinis TaxID=1070780 RepID=UPI0022FE2D25|nr:uncharacterized protein KD926_006532 [Aspergillus affinis]KAI9041808.1 hypothetical protein KD926_006532 [Aspergillus affinis]
MLDGKIEYRRGNYKVAFAKLREAVYHDDHLLYSEPWSWMVPARHPYAALLFEQGHVAEAATVYAKDLGLDGSLVRAHQHPNNVWSLSGYHDCLLRLGRKAEAIMIQKQLKTVAAVADIPVKSSKRIRISDMTNALKGPDPEIKLSAFEVNISIVSQTQASESSVLFQATPLFKMQPIILYSHQYGPNPWKVALILEELNIPYKTQFVDFSEVKKEPYVKLNPNGRLPTIDDPNTGLENWESGAILKQWLFFQASGQAPYYGQASWFKRAHPEKVQGVIDRYVNEIHRVTGVLESVLKTREWLVGDKCTYADLSFIAWQRWAPRYGGEDIYKKFPGVGAWIERMKTRPSVQKALADQDRAMAEAERN